MRNVHSDGCPAVRLGTVPGMDAQQPLTPVVTRLREAGWWSWLATAVVFGSAGGRRGRRAALRGLLAVAGSRGMVRAITVLTHRGERAGDARSMGARSAALALLPGGRSADAGWSQPSAEAASAAAFVTAAALESAPWTAVASVVGLVGTWDLPERQGARPVTVGAAVGAAAAVATLRWWPRIDTSPAEAPPAPERFAGELGPEGEGLAVVVNPGSGGGGDEAEGQIEEIRQGLPGATIVRFEDGDDLLELLDGATETAKALGVLGGDGSINAAAEVALAHGIALAVFPGGTLNHFARDLGVDTIAEAVDAVLEGTVVEVDTALIADRPFLNTASLGSYSELVVAREKLEDRIGKWPAMLVAMVKVLRHSTPTKIVMDGKPRRVWMIFLGNCAYDPPGFAPATRARLDDGLIDLRLVDGSAPAARLRLMLALLTGTLGKSRVYRRRLVKRLNIASEEQNPMLAVDGEVFEGPSNFVVATRPGSLRVYAPTR